MITSANPALGPNGPCRHDGWTDHRRRLFLAALSAGHSVERACASVGMSRASAYKCRGRDPAFARAWSAACLAARPVVALPDRSLDSRVRIVTRKNGAVVLYRGFDNLPDLVRLAQIDRSIARDPAAAALAWTGRSVADSAAGDRVSVEAGSNGVGEA